MSIADVDVFAVCVGREASPECGRMAAAEGFSAQSQADRRSYFSLERGVRGRTRAVCMRDGDRIQRRRLFPIGFHSTKRCAGSAKRSKVSTFEKALERVADVNELGPCGRRSGARVAEPLKQQPTTQPT